MKDLLAQGFDAVFVGSGAPKGKELDLPGRKEASANVHIGIEWLESVAFGHIDKIGEKVLIIGVGNTAMDCCRSSARLGGKDIKVMARRPRPYFKASPWELEDAEEEQVQILINHSPKAFVVEAGKLKGMTFERLEYPTDEKGNLGKPRVIDEVFLEADDVILAIGQEGAFPYIEKDIGIEFDKWGMAVVDKKTFQSTRPGVFFGGDAAWGPENIIWAVAHGHEAAISIDNFCRGVDVSQRLPQGMTLSSQKMGIHEWSYSNDYDTVKRQKMNHVDLAERFARLNIEVEKGFDAEQTAREVERCLNCDIQTAFTAQKCIECDACIDVCPVHCLTITPNAEEPDLRKRLTIPALNPKQELYVSADSAADAAGDGEGRGPVRALRAVRRALPDGGLGHAEVRPASCPTPAARCRTRRCPPRHRRPSPRRPGPRPTPPPRNPTFPQPSGRHPVSPPETPLRTSPTMHQQQIVRTNDFAFKLANVNGTGSASANGLLMQAIFRMGIPVSGKNLFPSNIQGLPTWYEIRVNKDGHTARAIEYDLLVAMNVETYARDVAEVKAGGWLLYDSSWPLPKHLHRPDIQFLGVPLAQLCNQAFAEPRERILMKNIAYAGVLVALLDIDMAVIDKLLEEKYGRKKALMDSNHKAIRLGYEYAMDNLSLPAAHPPGKKHAERRAAATPTRS